MNSVRIIARTDDTVTIKASDYAALVRAAEDAEDLALLLQTGAKEEAIGRAEARASHLPDALVGRLLGGEHPVAVWREHRGLSSSELAARAGLSPNDLADLESGTDRGSLDAYRALASALDVTVDDLLAA